MRVHSNFCPRLQTSHTEGKQHCIRESPYDTNSQEDNINRRQDLRRQQRPLNQVEANHEDDEQGQYTAEDINQDFWKRNDFQPLKLMLALLD